MKISIIVPVYKVEEYLEQCIWSLINQTYKNLEIILINDGSPDKCGQICNNFKDIDNRIKVIHKDNGGLSDARNEGLKIATGDYIGFVDSDDWIHKDMYNILISLAIKNNADIVECKFNSVYNRELSEEVKNDLQNNIRIFNNFEALKNNLYNEGLYRCVWNKIYKKNLFENIRFPVGKLAEDLFITYKLFYKANKIVLTDFTGYYYYIRNNSIMGNGGVDLAISILEAMSEKEKFISEKVPNLKIKMDDAYFKCLLRSYAILYKFKDDIIVQKNINYIKKELKRNDIIVKGKSGIISIIYNLMPKTVIFIIKLKIDFFNKNNR